MNGSMQAFDQIVRRRRSIRSFEPRPIPRDLIVTALQHAVMAPSAHNRQPWRFVVITDESKKTALAQAMGDKLRHDRLNDGDDDIVVEHDVMRSINRLTNAPALVVVCLTMEDMDQIRDPVRAENEHHMAVQSVAMAGQNLLLSLEASGLGACWLCAPLFAPEEVKSYLELPDWFEPQGLIMLGYPLHSPAEEIRFPLEKVVIWR